MRSAICASLFLFVICVSLFPRVPGHTDRPETADPFQAALVAAVHRFAEDGNLTHLKAILDKYPKLVNAKQNRPNGAKPSGTDSFIAIHHAALRGHESMVAYLLAKGADVNKADGEGWIPLHLAASQGHLPVVKLLVKAGAKVDAKTEAIPAKFGPGPGAPIPYSPVEPPEYHPGIPSKTVLDLAQEGGHVAVVEYLKSVR